MANTGFSFEYELKEYNFNPYTGEVLKNTRDRTNQLTTKHPRERGINVLLRSDVNDILCATIRHAFRVWGLRLTLAMADHLWHLVPVLTATVDATLVSET